MKVYLVGGAVRDQLLNLPVKERDYVVVGATPEQMIAQGYRLVGKDFPVFLHPKTHEEYALARTERKIGPGYKGFTCYSAPDVTLEQDLQRRDLTINAIAQTAEGHIIDPYHGQRDLQQKILRHISPAFAEDPVRILRIARFAARFVPLGFKLAHETLLLMQDMVRQGEVKALVQERVWQELARALNETAPQEFIRVLRRCGALADLFPELNRLFGVPNPPRWHPEIDSGVHTLMVLEQAARLTPDPLVRFAALVHDVGKGLTEPVCWPSHHDHEKKGAQALKLWNKRYRIPSDFLQLGIIVAQYHAYCHRVFELRPATLLQILEKLDAFRRPARFQQFLLACEADARGRPVFVDQPYPQREFFYRVYQAAAQVTAASLNQPDLTGPALGAALQQQRLKVIKKLLDVTHKSQ